MSPLDRVSIKDVCAKARVSRPTAYLALRGGGSLAPATVKRVCEAAKALGYKNDGSRGRYAQPVARKRSYEPTAADVDSARLLAQPWVNIGYDREECYGEAMIALARACISYKAEKGTFYTHLWWNVRSRLRVKFSHHYSKAYDHGVSFISGDFLTADDSEEPVWATIEDTKVESRKAREVMELLEYLTEDERSVIQRVVIEGHEATEVAESRGISAGEVAAAVESALIRLRGLLGWEVFDFARCAEPLPGFLSEWVEACSSAEPLLVGE
jgi:RNA polymerase sigma factor (sigma-70 family)